MGMLERIGTCFSELRKKLLHRKIYNPVKASNTSPVKFQVKKFIAPLKTVFQYNPISTGLRPMTIGTRCC